MRNNTIKHNAPDNIHEMVNLQGMIAQADFIDHEL